MSVYGQMVEEYEERIAALTAERDQLRAYLASRPTTAERDQLRAALLAVEWGGTTNPGFCPCCEFAKPDHAPDCIVGLALEGGK